MDSASNTRKSAGPLAWLRPSHQHSAFSATLLLMVSVFLSRVIGLVREKYIAYIFGAGDNTDAYRAAFQLPDMLYYFLVGGVASVSFISILGRYREQGREEEGERALAAVLSMMIVVLGIGVLIAEFFAHSYVAWWFNGFSPEKIALATKMTRILLPGQMFFFIGGVLGSVLLVRKQFAYQAVSPLLYNVAIISGGVLLSRSIGVSSLAVGALAGAFLSYFLLNYYGVWRAGVKMRLTRHWNHPGLIEWVKLSLPLMLGVSLVSFDAWIMNKFASAGSGEIARLNFAKAIFTAPMAILGQAAGAASMPFFAALIGQGRRDEFATQVNGSVTRIISISLMCSSAMIILSRPMIGVLLRGGALHSQDSIAIAKYLTIFAISLFLWSSQSIYARAFYAAGNTLTPMIAGTVILIASLPVYWALNRSYGATGLAIASDIGILTQTLAMAILLGRCKLVPMRGLDFAEIGRALLASLVSGALLYAAVHFIHISIGFLWDLLRLAGGGLLWMAACWAVLQLTGSPLPGQLISRLFRRKKPATTPA